MSQSIPKNAPVDSGSALAVRKARTPPHWTTRYLSAPGSRRWRRMNRKKRNQAKTTDPTKDIAPRNPAWMRECNTALCIWVPSNSRSELNPNPIHGEFLIVSQPLAQTAVRPVNWKNVGVIRESSLWTTGSSEEGDEGREGPPGPETIPFDVDVSVRGGFSGVSTEEAGLLRAGAVGAAVDVLRKMQFSKKVSRAPVPHSAEPTTIAATIPIIRAFLPAIKK